MPAVLSVLACAAALAATALGATFRAPTGCAYANFTPGMATTGWDILRVTTNASCPDNDQAYWAGWVEGQATYEGAWKSWLNIYGPNYEISPAINDWVYENWQWMNAQVNLWATKTRNPVDPEAAYWHQVGLQMQQFNGLLAGLNARADSPATRFTNVSLQLMVLQGDILDLGPAFTPAPPPPPPGTPAPAAAAAMRAHAEEQHRHRHTSGAFGGANWRNMSRDEFALWFAKKTHCSALIKLDPGLTDIWFGHATWSSYNVMIRTWKYYEFHYSGVPGVTTSFSSYPGVLSSIDDFYMVDETKLAIIETTNNVFNLTLYDQLTPRSVLYWLRVMIANRMATSAPEWVTVFSKYNSGTYNNQWMALDLKLFTPGKSLQPNTLWVAEQFPGVVQSADVTTILGFGYWPSYNVPYFKPMFDLAGYPEALKLQGPVMTSYEGCCRAEIFRRDQGTVNSIETFQHLIRYNNWQTDPFSQHNAVYSIASRGDLLPMPMTQCFGAIDAKMSSATAFLASKAVFAQSGPSTQAGVFDFATTRATGINCNSTGMPQSWNFGWQQF